MSENNQARARELFCPTLYQKCPRGILVSQRTIKIQGHIEDEEDRSPPKAKATVCCEECADLWARGHNRVLIGDTMTHGPDGKTKRIVIAKHPGQAPIELSTKRKRCD